MLDLTLTLQNDMAPASHLSGLAILNNLGIAVILVVLLLAILLAINYYRRREALDGIRARRKAQGAGGPSLVEHFPHMTRDELRTMIVKEKESGDIQGDGHTPKEQVEPLVPQKPGHTVKADASFLSSLLVPEKKGGKEETKQDASQPDSPEEPGEPTTPAPPEVAGESEESVPAKSAIHGRVERSTLSNDLPEEFRRRSRKI
jgi:hypothetical protein